MIKNWKKEILTIPNLLSLFRLLLIPVYLTIYLRADETKDYVLAAGILSLSCLTDMVDGKIARHFNMISTVGKLLDPVADKTTQFALMLCFSIEYPILFSLVGLFLLKETFQLVAGFLAYRKGRILTGALMSGKICTTILFLTLIIMVLFHDYLTLQVLNVITLVDAVFMLVAFIHYAFTYNKNTKNLQDVEE